MRKGRLAAAPEETRGAGRPGAEPGRGEPSLERRLERLEEIAHALEADRLELDDALALFEEAVGHIREAQRILAEAELKIEELRRTGSGIILQPLEREGE